MWAQILEALAKIGGLLKEVLFSLYLVETGKDAVRLEQAERDLENARKADEIKRQALSAPISNIRDSLRELSTTRE